MPMRPNNRWTRTKSNQTWPKSLTRYRGTLRTNKFAKHWSKAWQVAIVAVGGCVVVLATVSVAPSMLARSSASGALGTSIGAGTTEIFPFSFHRISTFLGIPFGTNGSW